jgi:AraC-like DNA-binding protein
MAKMTKREVADRANLPLEDALEALAKAKANRRTAARHLETATEFAERGLARLRSATTDQISVINIRVSKDPRLSASLGQGLTILSLFPVGGDELLRVADVADALGMSRSTVHRYLTTLVFYGQLEQPEGTRKYRRPQIEADVPKLAVVTGRPSDEEQPEGAQDFPLAAAV